MNHMIVYLHRKTRGQACVTDIFSNYERRLAEPYMQ